MKCELLTLCDAAADYNGKLSILGTFDTIFATQTPTVIPSCSIASRLRFEKGEEGEHSLKLTLVHRDGDAVMPPIEAKMAVRVPQGVSSAAFNFSVNLQTVQFKDFGEYEIQLFVGGRKVSTIPFLILKQG